MEKGSKSKVEFRRVVAPEPISEPEQQTAEVILARLIALAYAAAIRKPTWAAPPCRICIVELITWLRRLQEMWTL